jgi:hypothetical protein
LGSMGVGMPDCFGEGFMDGILELRRVGVKKISGS